MKSTYFALILVFLLGCRNSAETESTDSELSSVDSSSVEELEKGTALSSASQQLFRYNVDKSSRDWVVTFNQVSKIRHHTNRNTYAPYREYTIYNRTDEFIVKPGQWLEGRVQNTWSLLIDADHR